MNNRLFFAFLIGAIFVSHACAADPFQVMGDTFTTELKSTILGLTVLILLVIGGFFCAKERSFAPLLWVGVGGILLAVAPNAGPAVVSYFNAVTF